MLSVALIYVMLFSSIGRGQESDEQRNEEKCSCGISPLPFAIYGDVVTDTRLYPWLVSIHSNNAVFPKAWGYCGGSLISSDTVLTSAHCVFVPDGHGSTYNVSVENMEVGLLGPSLAGPDRKVAVKKAIAHPEFDPNFLANDIAVLKLAESVPCTEYTRPICITEEDLALQTDTLQIAGWGRVRSYERGDAIRDGTTCIVDSSECSKFNVIPHKIICTQGKLPQSCHSDSGTPGMYSKLDVKIEQYYVVGVASKREINCPLGYSGFYTRVAPYYHFITEAMKSE